ncbi:hypothetical protein F4861DRAFT_446948 [Xylaria intraflava]|nr:hypothetical protein F4861DRAFT_446948 [Xylaria intraflava]
MAMWPFRRMGSRRRPRGVPNKSSHPDVDGQQYPTPARIQTEPISVRFNGAYAGDGIKITPRRGRAYSFSPGRQDSLRTTKLRKKSNIGAHESPRGNDTAQRAPTLHHGNPKNKRSGQPLLHKKSSKRRKEDHDREAEIRAMTYIMPTRPTDSCTSCRPARKDNKQPGMGINTAAGPPSSEMSLVLPESIHSAMSSDSDQISWKVSTLDALSPRPTLRFFSNPLASSTPGLGLVRSRSTRKKMAEPIPESTLRAHRKVHDLVDDLDASDLRELLERDQRRKQRKIEEDRIRAERRLARRAERQRAAEAAAAENGLPPPANLERGILGREMPESNGDLTSAVVTSSRRRSSSESQKRSGQSTQVEELEGSRKTASPSDDFYRTDSVPSPEPPSPTKGAESAIPARSPSPKLFGFMRSKKSRSNSPAQSEQPTHATAHSPPSASIKFDDAESVSRTSDSRSSRHWLSLFRWGKNQRGSGPSSFSNTSRDSMQGSQPTPPTNSLSLRKTSYGAPKRTMSRFREDLPELPISPPDSRVASPEVDSTPAEPLPVIPDNVAMRYDTPVESHHTSEVMRASPISIHRDEVQPSPAMHSMSLASIDSEASWLSGRISRKHASSGMRSSLQYPPRTVSALSGRSEGQMSERTGDDNMADDDDSNSGTLDRRHGLSTCEARSSSEDDDSSPKWGAVGRVPTVIRHEETMQSRQGIIQSFDNDKDF